MVICLLRLEFQYYKCITILEIWYYNVLKLTKKVFRFVGVDVNEMAVTVFP